MGTALDGAVMLVLALLLPPPRIFLLNLVGVVGTTWARAVLARVRLRSRVNFMGKVYHALGWVVIRVFFDRCRGARAVLKLWR